MNDAGSEYPYKVDSKELFLKFWNIQWMMLEDSGKDFILI